MTTRIKHIVLGAAVTLALLVSSSPTWAQSYYATGYTPYVHSGYGFYGGYHGSTAAEGYLRGLDESVRVSPTLSPEARERIQRALENQGSDVQDS